MKRDAGTVTSKSCLEPADKQQSSVRQPEVPSLQCGGKQRGLPQAPWASCLLGFCLLLSGSFAGATDSKRPENSVARSSVSEQSASKTNCENALIAESSELQSRQPNSSATGESPVLKAKLATLPGSGCPQRDPFDTPAQISHRSALFGGQCIDTSKYRYPQLIEQNTDSLVITNYKHKGRFHKAVIPRSTEAIQAVYFHLMPFPVVPGVMAGHIQIRFVLKPGHTITLQDQLDPSQTSEVQDILISYEAAMPKEASYNFALGLADAYALVGRIMSGEQKVLEDPSREIQQYELVLDSKESAQLLELLVLDSAKIAFNEFYNTLRPNCTTKIFDAIDQLARLRGQAPFLTHIGGDPVIGPALAALNERGLIRSRVQNLGDELQGVSAQLEIPSTQDSGIPFLAQVPGAPSSLLTIRPRQDRLSAKQVEVLAQLEDDIVAAIPASLNQLLLAGFALNEPSGMAEALGLALQDLTQRLEARVAQDIDSLPDFPHVLQIYLAPYPGSGQFASQAFGRDVAIPLSVVRQRLDSDNEVDIYANLIRSIRASDRYARPEIPAHLKALALQVNLQRGQMSSEAQVLLGLQPRKQALEVVNEQVQLEQIVIPQPSQEGVLASALLSYGHRLGQPLGENVRIDFGVDTYLAGRLRPSRHGRLVINPESTACFGEPRVNPTLTGRLSERASGYFIDRFIQGLPVAFRITGLDFNLRQAEIANIQLSIGVLGTQCLSLESVNEQFRREANEMLEQLKGQLRF